MVEVNHHGHKHRHRHRKSHVDDTVKRTFPEPNTLDKSFIEAAKSSYISTFWYCIMKRANVNAQDTEGYTPLHYAVINKSYARAKMLLNNGADPNIQNLYGDTAVHEAFKQVTLRRDEAPEVKKLCQLLGVFGGKLDIKNDKNKTPQQIIDEKMKDRILDGICWF